MLLKDVLLQLFFIIAPIFLFHSFWLDSYNPARRKHVPYLIALSSSVSVLFCMTFPLQTDGGLLHDLRSIPIFLAILYGGYLPGLIVSLVMLAYRYYLGGDDGFYTTLIAFPLYAALPFFLVKRWYSFSRNKKIIMFLLIAFIRQMAAFLSVFGFTLYETGSLIYSLERMETMIPWAMIWMIASGITIVLTEYIRETTYIRNQIVRTEKLNLISELAASVAHEVRNPLTVVRGFVQLFRDKADQKKEEYIRLILTELDRAEFIISDYLNLAKPQAELAETLDLGKKVEEVAVFMSAYAHMRGVQIQLESEQGLLIYADNIKIKQIFMNIIKNGIEAMPGGGVIQVKAKRNGQQAVVEISDTGEGMNKEQLQQLGKPFFSTKEKGTGLGLLVTYRLIDSLGGTIKFDSEMGKGTTVTVQIPFQP